MNVGILGHVDSGKTSLAKLLSSEASTGAFDKHARSNGARGNTIDVGLSSLTINGTRLTLIDCPGHSTLIRAVLAVCPVFDMAIMVIDASRGIEAQTAEHLVLVQIVCPEHLLVVINKSDLVTREVIEQLERHLRRVLKANGLGNPSIVSISTKDEKTIEPLLNCLKSLVYSPERRSTGKFVMCVDHCFAIRGTGTIMTGTVIDGTCRIGMEVEIPELANERRRIKSLQSWHIDVTECSMGERVAVVLSQIAPQNIDRTLIAEPGVLIANRQLLASFTSIVHFKRSLMSHSKMHLAIGADMVMADVSFLAVDGDSRDEWELLNNCDNQQVTNVLIKFDRNVFTRMDTLLIAARLDAGGDGGKGCRFAFYGRVKRLETNDLRLFTRKMKSGRVERVESNGETLIVTGLFKKETKLELFIGMKLVVEFDLDDEKKRKESLTGDELNSLKTLSSSSPDGKRRKEAVIESSFGKSGKTRIRLVESLTEDELNCLKTLSSSSPDNVKLYFKKFLRDGSLVSYLPT